MWKDFMYIELLVIKVESINQGSQKDTKEHLVVPNTFLCVLHPLKSGHLTNQDTSLIRTHFCPRLS